MMLTILVFCATDIQGQELFYLNSIEVSYPGLMRYFTIAGNYAYIGGSLEGLYIVDISDSYNPILVSNCDTPGGEEGAFDVDVSGNYAYVSDCTAGLQVIDISDPYAPIIVSNFATPGIAIEVTVDSNYAYVVGDYGLQIIDISNPLNPVLAGFYDEAITSSGVDVKGNYVYLIDYFAGLFILDATDPANLVLLGNYNDSLTDCCLEEITVSGDYAYIASHFISANLLIIDVSDPSNPSLVASDNQPGALAVSIHLNGNYIFEGDIGLKSVLVYDVIDPANPQLVLGYETPGVGYGVYRDGNLFYLCDEISFSVLRFADYVACSYTPGDINGDGNTIGSDVTYGVNYFRGTGGPPSISCWNDPQETWQYSAGDVNGDCQFIGSDITYLVNFFRGTNPEIHWCAQTPPAGD